MLGYEVEEVYDFVRVDVADVIVLYGLLEDGLKDIAITRTYFSCINIDESILIVLDGGLRYIHGQIVLYWKIQ